MTEHPTPGFLTQEIPEQSVVRRRVTHPMGQVGRLCIVPTCPRIIPAGAQRVPGTCVIDPDGVVEAAGSGDGAAARRTVRLVVSGVDAVAARVA
jgi:hypothetical protein